MPHMVLIVEDDLLVADVVTVLIEEEGYAVIAATSGSAALDVLRSREPIDVMVTDVMMPLMNGIELAHEAMLLRPDLKIILTSGYPIEIELMVQPGWRFLPKPFPIDQLKEFLRELLIGA